MANRYRTMERFAELARAHAREREAYAAEIAALGGLTLEQARGLTHAEGCLRLSREAAAFFAEEGDGELARRFEALTRVVETAEELGDDPVLHACRAVEAAVDELTRAWSVMAGPVERK